MGLLPEGHDQGNVQVFSFGGHYWGQSMIGKQECARCVVAVAPHPMRSCIDSEGWFSTNAFSTMFNPTCTACSTQVCSITSLKHAYMHNTTFKMPRYLTLEFDWIGLLEEQNRAREWWSNFLVGAQNQESFR